MTTWNKQLETVNSKNEVVKASTQKAEILSKIFSASGKWFSESGEPISKSEMWEMDEAGKKFYNKVDDDTIYENN